MAKIKAYKFVSPVVAGTGSATSGINRVTSAALTASNQIGKSVEGQANILNDILSISKGTLELHKKQERQRRLRLRRERDRAAEERQESAKSKTKSGRDQLSKKEDYDVDKKSVNPISKWIDDFLGPFPKFFMALAAAVVGKAAWDILTDEEKREEFLVVFDKAKCVFGKIFEFVKGLTSTVWDGWKKITGEDSSLVDRLEGLGKILLGLAGLFYLFNPFKALKHMFQLIGAIIDWAANPKPPKPPKPPDVDPPGGGDTKPPKPPAKPKQNLLQKLRSGFDDVVQGGKDRIAKIGNWWSKTKTGFINNAKSLGKGVWDFGTKTAKSISNLANLVKDPMKLKDVVLNKLKNSLKPVLEKDDQIKKVLNLVKNPKKAGASLLNLVKNLMKSPAAKKAGDFLKAAKSNVKIGGVDAVIAGIFALLDYGVFGESPVNALLSALGGLLGYSAGFAIGAPFGGIPGFITGAAGGMAGEFIAKQLIKLLAKTELANIEDPLAKQLGGEYASRPLVRDPDSPADWQAKLLEKHGKPQKAKGGYLQKKSKGGIIAGAKSIIGMGKGTGDMCAATTRAALKAAGHPAAAKRTQLGDLDTPKGTAYNGPNFAASFAGTDMGKVITNRSEMQAGDLLLWRADRDINPAKGILKGAVTHVGIAADKGAKHQYDHNRARGFHHRPFWDSYGGTSWFAGIRLGGSGGSIPPGVDQDGSDPNADTGDGGGNVISSALGAVASLADPRAAFEAIAKQVLGDDFSGSNLTPKTASDTSSNTAANVSTAFNPNTNLGIAQPEKETIGNMNFSKVFSMEKETAEIIPYPVAFTMAEPIIVTQPINTSQKVVNATPSSLLGK